MNPTAPHPLPAALLAYHLAALVSYLPGGDSTERDRLYHIADLLHGVNPNTEAACAEAQRGMAGAARADHGPARPESWLFAAVAALLNTDTVRAEAPAGPLPASALARTDTTP